MKSNARALVVPERLLRARLELGSTLHADERLLNGRSNFAGETHANRRFPALRRAFGSIAP